MSDQEIPHVWGNIRHVFNPAILDEAQIHEEYLNIDSEQVLQASRVRDGLVDIIEGVQEQIGLGKVNILEATQEQRTKFAQTLKENEQWFSSFARILGLFDVDADPDEVIKNINRPWWNALQVNLTTDIYFPDFPDLGYSFIGKVSHSFIAQLGDAGLKTKGQPKYDVQTRFQPVSVGNLLFTSDNKLVLGYRGGQNFPDVIHVMPVGSAEPHLDRGAIWGSYDKENEEELNFKKENYSSAELVAVVTESLMARGKWHYWTFRTRTPMTSEQVKEHWQTAVDRKEHAHLEVYDTDPDKLLEIILTKAWDITKADPKSYATTTEANKGTWLPQCSISVLGSYAQELGQEWARDAEQRLNSHYDLTSCFR